MASGMGSTDSAHNDGSDRVEGLALPPWERRDRFGFLNGLYLTIKDVLLAPGRLFRAMPSEVGLVQPLLFAVVIGVASAFFAWMWSLAGSSFQMLVSDNLATVFREPLLKFLLFLFSPVIVAVLLFVETALVHLVLMVLGGNRLGFEASFRVMAYTEATSILLLVPLLRFGHRRHLGTGGRDHRPVQHPRHRPLASRDRRSPAVADMPGHLRQFCRTLPDQRELSRSVVVMTVSCPHPVKVTS